MAAKLIVNTISRIGRRKQPICSLHHQTDKWQYNDEEIAEIVKHMQTLSLLNDTSSITEQVSVSSMTTCINHSYYY